MKIRFFVFLLLVTALTLPISAHAQQSGTPIVILSGGMLQKWSNGTLSPLIDQAHIEGAALSPDGTLIAIEEWAPISVAAGPMGGGPMPGDIWIVDLQTGQQALVAEQPADASFMVQNVPDKAIARSAPTWSPDGVKLAWTELDYPVEDGSGRLVVADLAARTVQTIATLPASYGVPSPLMVKWGPKGLAVLVFTIDESTAQTGWMIQVYNPNGTLVSQATHPNDANHTFSDFAWVTYGGQDYIGVFYYTPNWDLLDPQLGILQAAPSQPELTSALNPAQSLALAFSITDATDFWTGTTWTAAYPNQQPISASDIRVPPNGVTIAPDGQSAAFITADGGLAIWQNGQSTTVVSPGADLGFMYGSIFWGPVALRVGSGQLPASAAPAACGSALPPHLTLGETAYLIPETTPNKLRSDPGTSSAVLGKINPGDFFLVLDGPQCADGMYWWQVNDNGTVGWTAEGDSSGYWLEPAGG